MQRPMLRARLLYGAMRILLAFSKYLHLFNLAIPARRPLQLPILQTAVLFDLPEELVLYILTYLDINDLLGCAKVSSVSSLASFYL